MNLLQPPFKSWGEGVILINKIDKIPLYWSPSGEIPVSINSSESVSGADTKQISIRWVLRGKTSPIWYLRQVQRINEADAIDDRLENCVWFLGHQLTCNKSDVFFYRCRSARGCCCTCFAVTWVQTFKSLYPPRWVWKHGWPQMKSLQD